jgi:large repetitive protein
MKSGRIFSLAIVALSFYASSDAQNLSQHNWYFGNTSNAIRFNRATNKAALVTGKAIPFGTGGSAVATDPSTADLLFYTDGSNVYDATDVRMLHGSGLTGSTTANQPAVVCAIPGQANKYFIFTNSANFTTGGTISSSVVDMTIGGNSFFPAPPLGDVVGTPVAVPGLTNRSEGMILVPHANGTDFWLITQQNNTQTYSATWINAASFTSGTFTTTTSNGIGFPTVVANFSYFKKTKKLAVSPQNANTDALILTFDDTAGTLVLDRLINNTGRATVGNQSIYDIEWDRNGQYLYISRTGDAAINADLLQYDYLNPTNTITTVLSTPVSRSYGLQLAPDSSIYYIYQATAGGPFLVDNFTKTDTIAAFVQHHSVPLGNVDFAGTQFPSFLPKAKVNLVISFTFAGTCQNNPTSFYPTVSPNADSIRWQFGDGDDTTSWSPIHKYGMAQAYTVLMTAYYQGDSALFSQTVTINTFSLQLQLVQDTTACRSEFPPPRGSSSPKQFSVKVNVTAGMATQFNWSNGDTGQILKPDSAGYYYVVATDGSGCSTYAGVNVKEYGLQDQRENIWYFGNHAGIDFNKKPPVALNTSAMDAPAGCAVACDRNGQIVLYTDGTSVWDKTNKQIATNIGGDSTATQSSLIFPVPGDETLYYIFTTQAINGTSMNELRYSLFDLKQNSGNGAVTQQNILMFSKSTERLTGNGNWLIAHEYGNNTFRAYKISSLGIGDPVYSAIGSNHSFEYPQNGEGYMKLGAKDNLAVALSTPGVSNLIEVFHFADSTGLLSNYRKIDLDTAAGQVYGVEFSPGGNKLYATLTGSPSPSELYEYFLDSLGKFHPRKKTNVAAELGAIQLAPDGKIYIAVNDPAHNGFLGTITPVDDTTKFSTFQLNGFALHGGTNSWLGLPNLRQQTGNAFGGPMFTFTGVCLGDSTKFVGTATDAIDNFLWAFGDGGGSTKPDPAHLYGAAKTYIVSMNLTNRCHLDTTIVQNVTVHAPPPLPTVPPGAVLCNGPITLNANTGNLPGLTYLWTTGDTTKTIIASKPEVVSVTNTDVNGCSSTAQSFIADNRPQLNLGPNQTVCQNTAVPPLDAMNPGANYQWQINGVNANTVQTQAVNTTVAGPPDFEYSVVVTDPITLCVIKDTVTFTVNVSPSFTLTPVNPTGCGLLNGSLTVNLLTSVPAGGPLYSYFITGPGGFNQTGDDKSAPSTLGPFGGLGAGTYSAVISDQLSGCTISKSIGLSDATFTVTPTIAPPDCDPVTLNISITGGGVALFTYTITNGSTGQVTSGTSPSATFPVTLPSQGSTTIQYTIDIKDNTNCTKTVNNFPVTPATGPAVTLTPSLCGANPSISATGATTYAWSTNVPGSIVGPANGPTVNLLAGAGTAIITVNASNAAGCPTVQSITADLKPAISPSFVQSDPCAAQVLLTASPVGSNYIYRWYLDVSGTLQPTNLVGQQVFVTTSGTYAVELTDTQTGCKTVSTPSKAVTVSGILSVTLAATQACTDNKPFTLTATPNVTPVTYAWLLNGTAITGANQATLSQTSQGIYEVDVSQGSCMSSAQLQVVKAPSPVGSLPKNWMICNDPDNADTTTSRVYLNPGVFSSYDWYKNQLMLNYTLQVYKADSEGLYAVDIMNSFGCTSTDQTLVTNECLPKIVAPNAFRPSSTLTANKEFSVFSFFITNNNFQVFIFNRWGELVFQSDDRYFKWNGNFNNGQQPLPGGTYAYVIKYVSSYQPDQGVQEKHGGVVLLR